MARSKPTSTRSKLHSRFEKDKRKTRFGLAGSDPVAAVRRPKVANVALKKVITLKKISGDFVPAPKATGRLHNIYQYKRSDARFDGFIHALADLVADCAQWALAIDNISSDGGGYFDLYLDLAQRQLAGKLSASDTTFLPARYGYAVEKLVEIRLDEIRNLLPASVRAQTQATRGMTRPDLILVHGHAQSRTGTDVVWIDFTADSVTSLGHIFAKASSGWKNKPNVYEITYPPLKPGAITRSGTPAEGVKSRRLIERVNRAMEQAIKGLGQDLEKIARTANLKTTDSIVVTREAFKRHFQIELLSHSAIRSLILLAGLDLAEFGYRLRAQKSGRDRATAVELVRHYYLQNGS